MLGSINGHDPRMSKGLSRNKSAHTCSIRLIIFNLRATFETGILEPSYASETSLQLLEHMTTGAPTRETES